MGGFAAGGLNSAVLIRKAQIEERGFDITTQTKDMVGADMAYVLLSAVMIFIITPGIGLFYAGKVRRKSAIQLLFQSYMVTCIVTVQWYLIGYSLACTQHSSSPLMGTLSMGAIGNIEAGPLSEGGTVASLAYWVFSCFFPVATVQIFVGAIAERGKILPSMIMAFAWTTICYCPYAYWTWAPNGWLYDFGALDFAGGGPVHVASGVASLTYSFFLGRRKEWKKGGKMPQYKGHSPVTTFIGVSFIWMTWLCFNSGTLLAVNARTALIMTNTQLAAAFACLTFTVIDKLITGRWSLYAACDGAIAGLVAITPSCGFVAPWGAVCSAIVTAAVCRLTYGFNEWVGIDDTTYSFNVHGIGGIVGSLCLGVLAQPSYANMDGVTEIKGGWIMHHWKQMGYQMAATLSIVVWTAVFTYILCFLINLIPGCKLRATEEEEEQGMDLTEMAETVDEYGEYFNNTTFLKGDAVVSYNTGERNDLDKKV